MTKRYFCPSCGKQTNSTRCPQCGNDTQQDDTENFPTRDPNPYRSDVVRNALTRAAAKQSHRRFSDSSITGFGGLQ